MIKKNNFSLKKGDTIIVISGKDKGKVSEITEVLRNTHQLVVKDVSNVMLYSLEKKIASRTCSQLDANGKKIRVLKKLL